MLRIHENDSYSTLLQQIRHDLRVQHPEWIQSNGQCPMCESYEARLIRMLQSSMSGNGTNNSLGV
jgi:hypothetical protein